MSYREKEKKRERKRERNGCLGSHKLPRINVLAAAYINQNMFISYLVQPKQFQHGQVVGVLRSSPKFN